MTDTTEAAIRIQRMISTGEADECKVAAVISRMFPELTAAELSQALQVATAAAERKVLRPH
jgi:hypothetical protein